MNPETKNQNSKQDYSFIMNQGEPAKKTGGSRKKLIIIGVLLVLLLGVVGASLLMASNNVQQESQTPSVDPNSPAVTDVINSFIAAAQQNDVVAMRAVFVDDLPFDEDYFTKNVVPFLSFLNMGACEPVDNREGVGLVDANGLIIRTYSCPTKDDEDSIGFEFIVKEVTPGNFKIHYYSLVTLE